MRKNLAERQEKMKQRLLAKRETFQHCAFRSQCCEQNPEIDAESCSRCTPDQLQELINRVQSPQR